MPNWACTNYIATGDMDELQEFARTLNTMPDLLKGSPFGFGRYWMGNLLAAFGMTREEIDESPIYCRGTFDPNFHAVACFCGPDVDEKDEFSVDADGRLRFSTVSAWGKSDDIEEFIMDKFPSIEFAWSSTDEFGNFHNTCNPEGFTDLPAFVLDGCLYSEDEIPQMREHAGEYIDLPPGADAAFFRSQEFRDLVDMYNEALMMTATTSASQCSGTVRLSTGPLPRRPANQITYGLQGTCMHDIPGAVRHRMLLGRRLRRGQPSA